MWNTILTIANLILTTITVSCTIVSIRHTKKQTEIMQKQLEVSMQPDFPTTERLTSIANAIRSVDGSIKNLSK